MPRARRVRKLWPIALSLTETAYALKISVARVERATRDGSLRFYLAGHKRLILVEDVVAWVRTWPRGHFEKGADNAGR
jgi:excisionase family DNA binding protein